MCCEPTIAVITNIGHSHIENLGSRQGILKAKMEILDGAEYMAPLVLPLDDKLLSKKDFTVTVEDGVYYVEADWLWDVLRSCNMDDYSSLQYFQRVLRSTGVIDRLEQLGIEEGGTVDIFGFQFDFVE